MKAHDSRDIERKWKYFVDKWLPFGTVISCAVFQAFSDAIAFIMKWPTGKTVVNYLDNFLFIALFTRLCQKQLNVFIEVCKP